MPPGTVVETRAAVVWGVRTVAATWLAFVPDGPPPSGAVPSLGDVIAANVRAHELIADRVVAAERVSPEGCAIVVADGFLVRTPRTADTEARTEWLRGLVALLREAGFSGRVDEPRDDSGSEAQLARKLEADSRSISTFVSLRPREHDPSSPDADLDRSLLDDVTHVMTLVGDALPIAGSTIGCYALGSLFTQPNDRTLWEHLPRWIRDSVSSSYSTLSVDTDCITIGFAAPARQMTIQQSLLDSDWRRVAHRTVECLTTLGPFVDVAFSRPETDRASWSMISTVAQPPPHVDEALSYPTTSAYRFLRGYWSERVFDAHGIQVLTRAHLDRTGNLDRWHVTSLGAERYLVVARDLAPWYAGATVDPATLAEARLDFGEVVMSLQEMNDVIRRRAEAALVQLGLGRVSLSLVESRFVHGVR